VLLPMDPCDLVQQARLVIVRIPRRGLASLRLRAPLNDLRTVLLVGVLLALPVPRCAAQATISGTRSFFQNGRSTDTVFSVSAVGDGADDAIRSTLLHDASGVADGAQVTDVAGAVASEGCEQVDPTTVRCVLPVIGPPPFIEIDLEGGSGNDLLVGNGVTEELRGGPGDDVLDGSLQPHGRLDGGPGADRLIAPAPTASAPFGGPMLDGGAGADVMTGNGLVAYDSRKRGIRINLRSVAAVQGAPGEGDVINGPNGVIGSDGNDVLIAGSRRAELQGGNGDDRLIGGPRSDAILGDGGSDVIRGGGGADELLGGNTRDGDRIFGGPGADRLLASAGADVLTGGAGADSVMGVGSGDVVRVRGGGADIVACDHPPARAWVDGLDLVVGCPRATVSRRGAARPRILQVGRNPDNDAPADGSSAFVAIGCPVDMPASCAVDVRLRDHAGAAGDGRVVARPGFTVGGTIRLTRRASRRARCSGQLRLTYAITFRTAAGSEIRLHRRHSEPVRQRTSACSAVQPIPERQLAHFGQSGCPALCMVAVAQRGFGRDAPVASR
jgi:hypothetical protein